MLTHKINKYVKWIHKTHGDCTKENLLNHMFDSLTDTDESKSLSIVYKQKPWFSAHHFITLGEQEEFLWHRKRLKLNVSWFWFIKKL